MTFLLLSLISAVPAAPTQDTPQAAPAAPAPAARPSLDGNWVNVDPATRGVHKMTIEGMKVHPYGRCHPNDCDWGVLKGSWHKPNSDNGGLPFVVASMLTNFSIDVLEISLTADGHLRVRRDVKYRDGRDKVPGGVQGGVRIDVFERAD